MDLGPRLFGLLMAVASGGACFSTPLVAQPIAATRSAGSSDFRALAERYRSGDHEAAVSELLALGERGHRAAIESGRADPKLQAAGALLQTEAALKSASAGELHTRFDAAQRMVERLDALGFDPAFRKTWYLAAASFFMATDEPARAEGLLKRAEKQFGDDPEVLLALGCAEEPPTLQVAQDSWKVTIAKAEAAAERYRRALQGNPALAEARLRLGWLHHKLRDNLKASAEVEQARRDSDHLFVSYLAALFLARLREDQGRLDDAIACYRAAVEAVPESQAANLGLANLLEVQAGRGAARATVSDMLGGTTPRSPERDPWWVYPHGQYWRFEARLAAMREAVRR